jgi:hypothetical protein
MNLFTLKTIPYPKVAIHFQAFHPDVQDATSFPRSSTVASTTQIIPKPQLVQGSLKHLPLNEMRNYLSQTFLDETSPISFLDIFKMIARAPLTLQLMDMGPNGKYNYLGYLKANPTIPSSVSDQSLIQAVNFIHEKTGLLMILLNESKMGLTFYPSFQGGELVKSFEEDSFAKRDHGFHHSAIMPVDKIEVPPVETAINIAASVIPSATPPESKVRSSQLDEGSLKHLSISEIKDSLSLKHLENAPSVSYLDIFKALAAAPLQSQLVDSPHGKYNYIPYLKTKLLIPSSVSENHLIQAVNFIHEKTGLLMILLNEPKNGLTFYVSNRGALLANGNFESVPHLKFTGINKSPDFPEFLNLSLLKSSEMAPGKNLTSMDVLKLFEDHGNYPDFYYLIPPHEQLTSTFFLKDSAFNVAPTTVINRLVDEGYLKIRTKLGNTGVTMYRVDTTPKAKALLDPKLAKSTSQPNIEKAPPLSQEEIETIRLLKEFEKDISLLSQPIVTDKKQYDGETPPKYIDVLKFFLHEYPFRRDRELNLSHKNQLLIKYNRLKKQTAVHVMQTLFYAGLLENARVEMIRVINASTRQYEPTPELYEVRPTERGMKALSILMYQQSLKQAAQNTSQESASENAGTSKINSTSLFKSPSLKEIEPQDAFLSQVVLNEPLSNGDVEPITLLQVLKFCQDSMSQHDRTTLAPAKQFMNELGLPKSAYLQEPTEILAMLQQAEFIKFHEQPSVGGGNDYWKEILSKGQSILEKYFLASVESSSASSSSSTSAGQIHPEEKAFEPMRQAKKKHEKFKELLGTYQAVQTILKPSSSGLTGWDVFQQIQKEMALGFHSKPTRILSGIFGSTKTPVSKLLEFTDSSLYLKFDIGGLYKNLKIQYPALESDEFLQQLNTLSANILPSLFPGHIGLFRLNKEKGATFPTGLLDLNFFQKYKDAQLSDLLKISSTDALSQVNIAEFIQFQMNGIYLEIDERKKRLADIETLINEKILLDPNSEIPFIREKCISLHEQRLKTDDFKRQEDFATELTESLHRLDVLVLEEKFKNKQQEAYGLYLKAAQSSYSQFIEKATQRLIQLGNALKRCEHLQLTQDLNEPQGANLAEKTMLNLLLSNPFSIQEFSETLLVDAKAEADRVLEQKKQDDILLEKINQLKSLAVESKSSKA